MKVLFCGSFKFLDEMKKLAKKLEALDFKCLLPKFALGDFSSKKIEGLKENRKSYGLRNGEFEKVVKITKWFYDRLKEADALIIFNKEGYIGLSLAAEIGVAHILGKPTFFLENPKDAGIKAILQFSENFEIVPFKHLVKRFKDLRKNTTKVKSR